MYLYTLEIYSSGSESVNDNNFYYLPFLNLSGDGILTLPPDLDGSYPITLPEPLPLGDTKNITTYTTAYVSTDLPTKTYSGLLRPSIVYII